MENTHFLCDLGVQQFLKIKINNFNLIDNILQGNELLFEVSALASVVYVYLDEGRTWKFNHSERELLQCFFALLILKKH
jgi:hypothetical protein